MNNVRKLLLTAFCIPLILVKAQNVFTLDEAVNYGLQNSNEYKNAQLDAAAQKEYAFEIMTEGFPKISAGLDYSYAFEQQVVIIPAGTFGPTEQELLFSQPHSATLKAELNQLVFDARYIYGLKARKVLLEIAQQQVEQARVDVTEDISKAYYSTLISEKAYNLLKENKETLEEILRETRATYEVGLIDELSVDRLELNLMNLESQIENQYNQYRNALSNLKYTIGMPQEDSIILNEDLSQLVEGNQINITTGVDPSQRIEAQLLDNRLQMRKYDVKQARSNYFPALYAYGSYGTLAQRAEFTFFDTKERWFDFGTVGFSLKIPIFDGLKAYSQVQQRKIEEQKTINDRKNFDEAVRLQFTNAQGNLLNAINNYNNQKENLALADKILNKTMIMFNEGVGTSFELSQAQQDYTNTMINYSRSIYNVLVAKLELKKVIATL